MPLSEHEQRLLDEMERSLYHNEADDVTTVGGGRARPNYTAIALGIIAGVIGIALLLVGVVSRLADHRPRRIRDHVRRRTARHRPAPPPEHGPRSRRPARRASRASWTRSTIAGTAVPTATRASSTSLHRTRARPSGRPVFTSFAWMLSRRARSRPDCSRCDRRISLHFPPPCVCPCDYQAPCACPRKWGRNVGG